MKWTLLIIGLIILYYFTIHRRGQPKFWRLTSKYPDSAYKFFEQSENWIVFLEKPEGSFKNALPPGEWDGPFKLAVPQLNGKMVTIFGKVPDYEIDQQNIIDHFGKLVGQVSPRHADSLAKVWDFCPTYFDKYLSIEQDMRDYQELALRAEQSNIRGDYRVVVELLEPHAGDINNENTSFFNELGIAYGKIGTQLQDITFWNKAYDYHKKAYDLDNNEPIYMFNLAMADTWIERYEEAKELMQKYLESGHAKERKLAKEILEKLKAM